jgi:hypothetical protein
LEHVCSLGKKHLPHSVFGTLSHNLRKGSRQLRQVSLRLIQKCFPVLEFYPPEGAVEPHSGPIPQVLELLVKFENCKLTFE